LCDPACATPAIGSARPGLADGRLPDDVRKGMESDVADITQVKLQHGSGPGHMLQGGVFLVGHS